EHAGANASVDKAAALEFLQTRSRDAAAAVRLIPDEKLDNAAPVSLNADAPLTCQFFIEDHALRHSFHHLAKIRAAVGRQGGWRCRPTGFGVRRLIWKRRRCNG